MTQTATAPPNTTIVSTLPHKDTPQLKDRLLCIQEDGTLEQLLASSLASQGPKGDKGDTGEQGPEGSKGQDGKDATAPPFVIFPYYDETPPEGYLFLHGQTFDPKEYPVLAVKLPNNTLPDFRDRVPRGAGDLIKFGDTQEDALQNITGTIGSTKFGGLDQGTGAFAQRPSNSPVPANFSGSWTSVCTFDASRVARTATETRVKAIGVNFIIKAT